MFPSKYLIYSIHNHGHAEELNKTVKSAVLRRPLVLLRSGLWALGHPGYYLRRERYFPRFEVLLPRSCPFDCKCCIHFISDYKDAPVEPAEVVIGDLRKLLDAVDLIDEVSISGGDAFLYPELAEVVKFLLDSPKTGKVVVVATGAVSPDPAVVSLLENKKLELKADNYGSYSVKLHEFQALPYENVKYYGIYDEWSDFGDETCRNQSEQELDRRYAECRTERFCLLGGKIYGCPRCAHGENLGYFTCREEERVDLRGAPDKKQLLSAIRRLRQQTHLTSCNYCNSCTPEFRTYKIETRFRDGT